jgi:hypothetical protein
MLSSFIKRINSITYRRPFTYYAITNQEEKHQGHQYVDGLNILDNPRNHSNNGLHYTTKENINKYYSWGIYLRRIDIPIHRPTFCTVFDLLGYGYRANQIILGSIYSLFDIDTYKIFELNMKDNAYIVDFASATGNMEFLYWWQGNGTELEYSSNSMDFASEYGHIEVLDWWKNSRLDLKYNGVMDLTAGISPGIIDWWVTSGLQVNFTSGM